MPNPNIVQLQKARLAMGKTMQDLVKQTQGLEKALKAHGNAQAGQALKLLRGAMKEANEHVLNALDDALKESDGNKRNQLYQGAAKTAQQFVQLLRSNPQLRDIEHNEVFPVPAAPAMASQLQSLSQMLH
jgi:hypothetical protein